MATRDELVTAVVGRYSSGTRAERGLILDEFTSVTSFHRKHAMRLLRRGAPVPRGDPRSSRRVYDDAIRAALVVLWEASDRICGKRLRPLVPILVESMERHGHVTLAPEVRSGLLAMSASTIDPLPPRLHQPARSQRSAPLRPQRSPLRSLPRSVHLTRPNHRRHFQLSGLEAYAYSGNNPTSLKDPTGAEAMPLKSSPIIRHCFITYCYYGPLTPPYQDSQTGTLISGTGQVGNEVETNGTSANSAYGRVGGATLSVSQGDIILTLTYDTQLSDPISGVVGIVPIAPVTISGSSQSQGGSSAASASDQNSSATFGSPVPVVLSDGTIVQNPRTGGDLLQPMGVSLSRNAFFGLLIGSLGTPLTDFEMAALFMRGGSMDYQRLFGSSESTNRQFVDFGNYNYGVVAAAAGYYLQAAQAAAGYLNHVWGGGDQSGPFYGNPRNIPFITAGCNAYNSGAIQASWR